MGVDAVVLFDCQQIGVVDAEALTANLNQTIPTIRHHREVWRKWSSMPVRWPTQLAEDPPYHWTYKLPTNLTEASWLMELSGPFNFHLSVLRGCIEWSMPIRWWSLVTDAKEIEAMHAFSQQLAQCLPAPRYVLVPEVSPTLQDGHVEDGASFEELMTLLKREYGDPEKTVSALGTRESDDYGYYVHHITV